MQVVLYGMNHRTAPVALRERLAAPPERLQAAMLAAQRIPQGPSEVAVLATCNRFEMYLVAPSVEAASRGANHLVRSLAALSLQDFREHLYHRTGDAAVRHLFRVASGLDSMVLGEPEILGQVGDAYTLAQQAGTVGPILHRLFQHAVATGKRVRRETAIGRAPASVGSAAAHLVREYVPKDQVASRRALVVGAGAMARTAGRHLRSLGFRHLAVMNRSPERGAALARELEASTFPWGAWLQALTWADVVITATAAPTYILGPEPVQQALAERDAPLLIVDIGVPRNVHPRVAELPGVQLFDIDDLRGVVDRGLALRKRAVPRAQAIVDEETEAFMAWWRTRLVAPTLQALYRRAEDVRREVLRRTLKRLQVNGDTEAVVDEVTRILVEKLLQIPARNLRHQALNGHGEMYARMLAELFELEGSKRVVRKG